MLFTFSLLDRINAQDSVQLYKTPNPIGKLIDVNGHKMHIYVTGKGGPSVIFEAGAGAFSFDSFLVQKEVEKFTQACSYDRAGHAWSELGPKPRTMRQAVYDLHTLLKKAHIPGPYILVGHSHGGKIVRVFPKDNKVILEGLNMIKRHQRPKKSNEKG